MIEYKGERITRRESRRRSLKAQESYGNPRVYLFRVNNRWVLDGSVGGSGAEYINHSCEANLRTSTEDGRVHYWSRRIAAGEELTIDYKFPRKGPKVRCNCGAPLCRGTLNLR